MSQRMEHDAHALEHVQLEQMESIHRRLLTRIADFLVVGSPDYNNFIEQLKTLDVSRNVLTQDYGNLLKIFEHLETRNFLHAGNYEALKSTARNSKVESVLQYIDAAEQEMQTITNHDSVDSLHTVLQLDLINYYRELLSHLQLSPLFDEEGYAANLLGLYVKPILTIASQYGAKGQSKLTQVKTFHDIFVKNSELCKHIYISSPAGCGKTSILKYLALAWCQAHLPIVSDNQWFLEEDINEMRKFKFLFFVYLRDSNENECEVDIMIQQLLRRLTNSDTYANSRFLQKLLSNVKCIILLDGLDEWNHPNEKQCLWPHKHIPHSKTRPLCTTLTTSRPWKLDVVGLRPEEIDQKLELNGLEYDLLKHLIDKVVKKLNELYKKGMSAIDFELELQNRKLTHLSKIPVVVMQLLAVWFDYKPLGKTQCEIYSNMIQFLYERYCKKREIVVPVCLKNNMYCKVHMELISKLAKLAYNTLFTDIEESSLVFDRRIAKKYLSDQEIEMSLAIGILAQEKVIGKIAIRQSHISFIHKTFQEYLAALYVSMSPGTMPHVEVKIKRVCCSIEKIMDMTQIFMFMCGLCPEVMVNLHEHLRETVSHDSRTKRYRASCELDPELSSEGQTLRQVQRTMMEWLVECWLNGHKHITHFPVSDFFIGGSFMWSPELKSLAVHNPICSLFVGRKGGLRHSEIEVILNSITVFNSIQKLWLPRVSETFLGRVVSEHKQNLSVKPETCKHLECITLTYMDMSGDMLCSFVDFILQLPKSVYVRLPQCCITKVTVDWKPYIRSHPRLTVDADKVSHWDNGTNDTSFEMLQFHTNRV